MHSVNRVHLLSVTWAADCTRIVGKTQRQTDPSSLSGCRVGGAMLSAGTAISIRAIFGGVPEGGAKTARSAARHLTES